MKRTIVEVLEEDTGDLIVPTIGLNNVGVGIPIGVAEVRAGVEVVPRVSNMKPKDQFRPCREGPEGNLGSDRCRLVGKDDPESIDRVIEVEVVRVSGRMADV